jgi:Leucine-rich repeat (LRR) protein
MILVTLFQVPQYEHLQILICNGNSLTTLAGVEHIKHLWKLDVGNNQVLQNHLKTFSQFIYY